MTLSFRFRLLALLAFQARSDGLAFGQQRGIGNALTGRRCLASFVLAQFPQLSQEQATEPWLIMGQPQQILVAALWRQLLNQGGYILVSHLSGYLTSSAVTGCRHEQFFWHAKQCCQFLLRPAQIAHARWYCWHINFIFLLFIVATHHFLSGQPDNIQRSQVASHQFFTNGNERSQVVFGPYVGSFHFAKFDIEDVIVLMAGEAGKILKIVTSEEIVRQDATREAKRQLGRPPVGPVEKAIKILMQYIDRIVLEIPPVIFNQGMGGRYLDMAGQGIDLFLLLLR